MRKSVIIIGVGGHSKVVADIIRKNGDEVFGFLDDDITKSNTLGTVSECEKYSDKHFIIAIGNNYIRKKISEMYPKLNYYTAIHPSAVIADDVKIGDGSCICANAVINPDTCIGEHCIINTAAVVEHDCNIADYVHISPNATVCGTVCIGNLCWIGAAGTVKNNISINNEVITGAGAVVVKDIAQSGTYVGIPAESIDRKKGIGCDVVKISRFEKLLIKQNFVDKIYTKNEQKAICEKGISTAAGYWAAKEAVMKALGSGMDKLKFSEIEIYYNKNGKPEIALYGKAAEEANGAKIEISISHEKDYAVAFAGII